MIGVVLIDDEYYVLKSLENRLDWDTLGFRILGTASSADEGMALCERMRPEVVFTDIRMPGMDGLAFIRNLRQTYPEVLTIVMSGYAEFAYAKEAINLGAIGFCSKPFDDEELCEVLRNAKRILDARGKKENAEDDVQGPSREICAYLRTHYSDVNLSVQSVAETFGFHPNYLSQLFKRATGENLIAFLTKVRVEHACKLLQESNLSVGEIGERVGYPEYFYFAKVFKKQTGFTLSEYRKNLREPRGKNVNEDQ